MSPDPFFFLGLLFVGLTGIFFGIILTFRELSWRERGYLALAAVMAGSLITFALIINAFDHVPH